VKRVLLTTTSLQQPWNEGDWDMSETVTASIRDALVMKCVKDIAEITGEGENLVTHAALVFFVAEGLTGLGDVYRLREQLAHVTSSILDRLTEETE